MSKIHIFNFFIKIHKVYMSIMKKIFFFLSTIAIGFLQPVNSQSIKELYKLQPTNSFFEKNKNINSQQIKWFYLYVPENWNNPTKQIKLAVAIISSFKKSNKNVVHISGGPGGWNIGAIKKWLDHPIRNVANIVLVDLRGTGFSKPELCPELGNDILQLFAQNNLPDNEINAIVNISKNCKKDLIERDIDLKCYNSLYISKDLNALKKSLNIQQWFVYGVSYGTHIAQVYARYYPNDFEGIILDSPIPNIYEYYKYNTTNYITSLTTLFKESKSKFPNLESQYYAVIDKLSKKGITVNVDKSIIKTGQFTYNVGDFQIIIQQSLYNRQLIEVIPLIITSFYNENKSILSTLVSAFSDKLKRDFGTYYCVTCNDGYTDSSIVDFDKNASTFKNNHGGLLFYRSDLFVCKKWELKSTANDTLLDTNFYNIKALVFSGKYDPITPLINGRKTSKKFRTAYLFEMPYGHGTSFSNMGRDIVESFVNGPDRKSNITKDPLPIQFISNIKFNRGIIKIADSLNKPNLLFLSPLMIAIILALGALIYSSFSLFRRNTKNNSKILNYILVATSLTGLSLIFSFLWAIFQTSNYNSYILLFGLPSKFSFLFGLLYIYIICTALSILYLIFSFKKIRNIEIRVSFIFSFLLIIIYFIYWGVL